MLPYLPEDFKGSKLWANRFQEIMFIRLRVSSTNLLYIIEAAERWGNEGVPVVLTFMRYYDIAKQNSDFYIKKQHIKNIYWCPTEEFMQRTVNTVRRFNTKIEMCGHYCRDCLNCEKYYYKTKERMGGNS